MKRSDLTTLAHKAASLGRQEARGHITAVSRGQIIAELVNEAWRGDCDPQLGCATTKQLIDELQARAEVSAMIEESWPNYRTVGS